MSQDFWNEPRIFSPHSYGLNNKANGSLATNLGERQLRIKNKMVGRGSGMSIT